MSFKSKFNHFYSFFLQLSNSKITTFTFITISVFSLTFSQECKQISNCKCKFSNGSVIDLTSLSKHSEARFVNVSTKIPSKYTYYYNPCYSFSIGEGECRDVSVCQVSTKKPIEYHDCGKPNSAFDWNAQTKALNLIYFSDPRTTNVTLICSSEALTPNLEVKGEPHTNLYEMTLTTRCACPDLCRNDHLSAGSVLVILFLVFVSLYLILGIIHSNLTRGASGWELIPHYEFWADFPLLVRDGCVFVMSGCKADTAYERI